MNEAKVMAPSRRSIKLTISKADLAQLESIARSRTEPAGRVERSRILLAYRQDPSFYAVAQAMDCMLKLSNAALSEPRPRER